MTALLATLLLQLPSLSSNPVLGTLFMYGAIFAIFYFVLLRPQQQQRKRHEALVQQLKRGDEIVTAGGIVGEVVQIRQANAETPGPEDRITIRSGEARLVVERGRIAKILTATAAPSTTTPAA